MNTCSAGSGTSTSSDLNLSTNESRREEYLAKILHSERSFNDVRLRLYKAKMAQLEKLQDDILNRRCSVFQRRKSQLDSEFDTRRKNLQIIRTLRLDALNRKLSAQRDFALGDFEQDKEFFKQQISKRINEKMSQVENEMRQIEDNFYSEDCSTYQHKNKISRRRLGKLKWGIGRYIPENNKKEEKRRKWQNLPIMVAQLPESKIMEDLELIL
ncbi:hypothetical protein Mgra_00004835 [Meloidogyne graminicola]|uniref:Uncharacterized protein n=1 Tax=Meloidogyne graminicola TaxID=189291 RepID=A0A8S9ZRD0_9BILA|nr:hypothetical protein Mgra_00004835 [Meloidogyne graminicola]